MILLSLSNLIPNKEKAMESHWLYNNELLTEVPSKAFGFVYMITNTLTGKMYIGRKYFV